MKFASLAILAVTTAWAGHAYGAKGGSIRRSLDQLAEQVESGEEGAIKGSRIGLSQACRDQANARLKQIIADYQKLSPEEQTEVRAALARVSAALESMPPREPSSSPSTPAVDEASNDRCGQANNTSGLALTAGIAGLIALYVGLFIALPAGIRRLARRWSDDS